MTTGVTGSSLTVEDHARGMISTSAVLLVRRVVVTLGAAIATGVLTRQLTTGQFGVYSAALATFYLAQAVCDLGFGAVLARELSTRAGDRAGLLRAALRPAVVWSVVVSIGFGVFAATTSGGERLHILLALIPAVAISGASVARQWFVVRYDVRRMGLVDLVVNVAQVVALIVVALLGGSPLLLAVVVGVTTLVNTVVVATLALRESGRVPVQAGSVRELVWLSLPIGIPSILASAYFSVDLVLAGYLVPASEVAGYAAAVKLLTLVTMLPSILLSVALVGFSAVHAGGDKSVTGELAARSWRWLMALVFPICVALFCFAPLACRLFFGPDYVSAAPLLRILMASGALALLGGMLGTLLIAARRTAITLIQNSLVLALNVGLNVVLLPRYGITAAAWITLGTEILSIACALVILRSTLTWGPSLAASVRPLIACAVLAAISFVPLPNDFLRAGLAGAGFLAAMTFLRAWPFDPRGALRRRGSAVQTAGTV